MLGQNAEDSLLIDHLWKPRNHKVVHLGLFLNRKQGQGQRLNLEAATARRRRFASHTGATAGAAAATAGAAAARGEPLRGVACRRR